MKRWKGAFRVRRARGRETAWKHFYLHAMEEMKEEEKAEDDAVESESKMKTNKWKMKLNKNEVEPQEIVHC